jgi:hypothetical protein
VVTGGVAAASPPARKAVLFIVMYAERLAAIAARRIALMPVEWRPIFGR